MQMIMSRMTLRGLSHSPMYTHHLQLALQLQHLFPVSQACWYVQCLFSQSRDSGYTWRPLLMSSFGLYSSIIAVDCSGADASLFFDVMVTGVKPLEIA